MVWFAVWEGTLSSSCVVYLYPVFCVVYGVITYHATDVIDIY